MIHQHHGRKHSCNISKHSFDQGSYFIQRWIIYRCGMLLNGAKNQETEFSLTTCNVFVVKIQQDCLKPFEQVWFCFLCCVVRFLLLLLGGIFCLFVYYLWLVWMSEDEGLLPGSQWLLRSVLWSNWLALGTSSAHTTQSRRKNQWGDWV